MQAELKILVIDDNPDIHRDFIKILTKNNSNEKRHFLGEMEEKIFGKASSKIAFPKFNIDSAAQGQEGVQKIENSIREGSPYALAFVDIRMPPGWDGIETIKKIWQIDPDIQIVICTAYSDYSWEETVEQLGDRENLLILKKPFDHVAVRQLSCALTKKWKLMQENRAFTDSLQGLVDERTNELQQSLAQIEYQATHDILTGLPNRAFLMNYIQKGMMTTHENTGGFGILFFDLDRFKLINDSFSHLVGDELLRLVAERLKNSMREKDVLSRLGGDEFVAVITFEKENDLIPIANKLLQQFADAFAVANQEVIIGTSMGIAVYPRDGKDINELLRSADIAMYRAKEKGGSQYQFYTGELNNEMLTRLEMETDLRKAIQNNEFYLSYQPQYNVVTQEFTSVEALVRWRHPTKGTILPIEFIPLAEQTGLIMAIGTWVLKAACQQNKAWQNAGLKPIKISVNVATGQLKQPDFVNIVLDILKETKLDPKYLELELTENIIINNIECIHIITELKNHGISVALDDFGTGYSSINYLTKIPLDRLKIDKSFVEKISINRGDEVIIQAIISMAHDLNLEVLAEGVENKTQLDFLKEKKCVDIQGFYFSKPLSNIEVQELLEEKDGFIKKR